MLIADYASKAENDANLRDGYALRIPMITHSVKDADGWITVSETLAMPWGEILDIPVGAMRAVEPGTAQGVNGDQFSYEVMTLDMGADGGLYAYSQAQAVLFMTSDVEYLRSQEALACTHEHNALGRDESGYLVGACCLKCEAETRELVISRGTPVQL